MINSFEEIITKGIFYYPAYKHYNRICTVNCDRCAKSNINACVGYQDSDLCMKCVEFVTTLIDAKKLEPNLPCMRPIDDLFKPRRLSGVTKMMRDSIIEPM